MEIGNRRNLIIILLLLSSMFPAYSLQPREPCLESLKKLGSHGLIPIIRKPWWQHFQLGIHFVLPAKGRNSIGPSLFWTPMRELTESYYLRSLLGFSVIKFNQQTRVFSIEVGAKFGINLNPMIQIEVGPQILNWVNYGGYHLGLGFQCHWRDPLKDLPFLQSIFLGYALGFHPEDSMHQIGLGVVLH